MSFIKYNIDSNIDAFSSSDEDSLPYKVLQMHQVHGDKIVIVEDRNTTREDLYGYDAIITNLHDLAIGVRSADCVPILLYDPCQNVIAAIHSGWRGTVLKISQKVIQRMITMFSTNPEDIIAVICPSIGIDAFQIGEDVFDEFAKVGFRTDLIGYKHRERNENDIATGYHIDLQKANEILLLECGLQKENIYTTGICTYQNHTDWHSARWTRNNKCRRNINAIKIL